MVSLNRGSIRFYRSYQIYKKFYVRINFIKLILQKIRSSTCKGERGAPELAKIRLQIKINHIFRARRAAIQNDHPLGGGFGPARRACRFGWPQQFPAKVGLSLHDNQPRLGTRNRLVADMPPTCDEKLCEGNPNFCEDLWPIKN